MLPLKDWWSLVKKAGSAWLEDYAPSMGAALSYYTVFSLAPMLLIVVAVAGLVFGQDAARGALFEQLSGLMGADAAKAVEGILASVEQAARKVLGVSDRCGRSADRCNHRLWRAAGCARPHLALAGQGKRRRDLGTCCVPAFCHSA